MSNTRTTNRNGRTSTDPELQKIWATTLAKMKQHDDLNAIIRVKNARLLYLERSWVEKGLADADIPLDEVTEVTKLYQERIKLEEQVQALIVGSDGQDGIRDLLVLVEALQNSNEEPKNPKGPNKHGNNLAKPPGNMDGAADSAASSPALDSKPRITRPQKLSSQPPKEAKEASVKREDSEVPDVSVKTAKVVFALGAEVAFKPKSASGTEESDWIQGTVVRVIGEGKSRRYDVQDPEPDEKTGKQAIIRTSATSMVTIPPLGAPLPEYPKGKHVLARYPDTTTFYRAEVAGNIGNEVMLKFEGEEDKERVLNVDRRFVLDHRG